MSKFDEIMREFHAHLDGCKQCEQHPFDLCSEGQRLMNLKDENRKTNEIYTGCRCAECRPDLQY